MDRVKKRELIDLLIQKMEVEEQEELLALAM
jgi:hypothetical protein